MTGLGTDYCRELFPGRIRMARLTLIVARAMDWSQTVLIFGGAAAFFNLLVYGRARF